VPEQSLKGEHHNQALAVAQSFTEKDTICQLKEKQGGIFIRKSSTPKHSMISQKIQIKNSSVSFHSYLWNYLGEQWLITTS
jgi:hypothetical protein